MANGQPIVHVVAESIGPRLLYVCHIVFERLLGVDVKLHLFREYQPQSGTVLYYGADLRAEKVGPGHALKPNGLLEATGTAPIAITDEDELAAVFWLVTQYASYEAGSERDAHGRPVRSFLPGWENANEPVCHALAYRLAERLGIHPAPRPLRLEHTLDIDNAYAYQAKGALRWTGSLLKELAGGSLQAVGQRLNHALGRSGDPYDTHDQILSTFGGKALRVFFLLSDKSPFDRAIPTRHPDFRRLVHVYQQAGAQIGLHPSYAGGQSEAAFRSERERLEGFTETPIDTTRYHYLRMLTPHTQRLLLAEGIRHDFSPGPVQPGFWQGISVPIPWYDVETDTQTDLMLYPAVWMDVHWADRPEEGLEHLRMLRDTLSRYGGELVCIWHNDYFRRFAELPGFAETIS